MTPPPATVAGRGAGKKRKPTSAGGAPPPRGHRRALRQQPGPKAPRRVSGPVGGVIAVPTREQTAPPARTPEPVRAPAPPRTTAKPRTTVKPRTTTPKQRTRRRTPAMPLGARALRLVRTLPDHRLLDRLIRGRAWIPVLGVMLAGIVAMQVEVLKLGASIGRSIQRTSALQTRNETLREAVASLDGDARIEALAAKQGMVMPAPGGVGFLSAGDAAAAVGRALANIHAPDAPGFLALTSTNGTIASSSNSSPSGSAVAAASATLANTLAQSASQTSSATSASQTSSTSTTAPASTQASAGAQAPTSSSTPTGSSAPTTSGSSPTGTSSQQSSSSAGTTTPVSTPTQSTSGTSSSGGATIGG